MDPTNIIYGLISDIGQRESMEDEHAIYRLPDKYFFSAEIYDGHGGRRAAQAAAEGLTPYFLHVWEGEPKKPIKERKTESEMLREAYLEIDNRIMNMGIHSGTTAATFYIINDRFIAGNVGDTRIILGTKNGVYSLTIDHRPYVAEEKARIEKLGGWISRYGTPRLQGTLAVSRALGDTKLKPFISNEPRIVEGNLGKENDYAVLACDGVWDVLGPEDVIEAARTRKDAQEGAEQIKESALNRGSTDNISVIVLDLREYTCGFRQMMMAVTKVTDYA